MNTGFKVGPRRLEDVTWADWRKAVPGVTRVRNNRTGWTGTIAFISRNRHGHNYVTVLWDESGSIGNVNAPAYDLTVIA